MVNISLIVSLSRLTCTVDSSSSRDPRFVVNTTHGNNQGWEVHSFNPVTPRTWSDRRGTPVLDVKKGYRWTREKPGKDVYCRVDSRSQMVLRRGRDLTLERFVMDENDGSSGGGPSGETQRSGIVREGGDP